jgi:hypothetical protein
MAARQEHDHPHDEYDRIRDRADECGDLLQHGAEIVAVAPRAIGRGSGIPQFSRTFAASAPNLNAFS